MKKLVLLLSFVFVLGLVSVEANTINRVAKSEPVKTEQAAKKKAKTHKAAKKVKKGTKTSTAAPKTVKK
ncbi:MAG: hypothetical protein NTY07_04220 [Bacteroidia bacterium]|nr:hypothetical protein [Bacteroidia bacterium]